MLSFQSSVPALLSRESSFYAAPKAVSLTNAFWLRPTVLTLLNFSHPTLILLKYFFKDCIFKCILCLILFLFKLEQINVCIPNPAHSQPDPQSSTWTVIWSPQLPGNQGTGQAQLVSVKGEHSENQRDRKHNAESELWARTGAWCIDSPSDKCGPWHTHYGEQVCRTQEESQGRREHKPGQGATHSREDSVWGHGKNAGPWYASGDKFHGSSSVMKIINAESMDKQHRSGRNSSVLVGANVFLATVLNNLPVWKLWFPCSHASTEHSLKAVGSAHGSPFISFSGEIRAVPPVDSLGRSIPPDRENLRQSVRGLTFWLQHGTFSAASPLSKYKAEPKTRAVLPRDMNSTLGCPGGICSARHLQGNMRTGNCYRCRDSNPRTSWSLETRKGLGACPEHSCLPLRGGPERWKSGSPGWEAAIGSFQAFCTISFILPRVRASQMQPGLCQSRPLKMLPSLFIFWKQKFIIRIEHYMNSRLNNIDMDTEVNMDAGQVLGVDIKTIWACTWSSLLPSLKTHCSSWRHPLTLTCLLFTCLCITITYELCTLFCINFYHFSHLTECLSDLSMPVLLTFNYHTTF